MWPDATSVPTAKVQDGAVSVMPSPVMMRTRSPVEASACASSLSHTAWLSDAPANMKALQWLNSVSRNKVSQASASRSIALAISSRPLGTLK
jgi:hypothetical protein